MHIGPNAALDDGIFDVVIIGDTGKLEIVVNLPRIYRGTHLSHPKVDEYRAREIRVEARERMLLTQRLTSTAPGRYGLRPGNAWSSRLTAS
jgi:diacylglycerol kinase family enzyme